MNTQETIKNSGFGVEVLQVAQSTAGVAAGVSMGGKMVYETPRITIHGRFEHLTLEGSVGGGPGTIPECPTPDGDCTPQ